MFFLGFDEGDEEEDEEDDEEDVEEGFLLFFFFFSVLLLSDPSALFFFLSVEGESEDEEGDGDGEALRLEVEGDEEGDEEGEGEERTSTMEDFLGAMLMYRFLLSVLCMGRSGTIGEETPAVPDVGNVFSRGNLQERAWSVARTRWRLPPCARSPASKRLRSSVSRAFAQKPMNRSIAFCGAGRQAGKRGSNDAKGEAVGL